MDGRAWNLATFTIVSLVIALICYLFDPGPLMPPFDKLDTVDCHSISFTTFSVRDGAIDVQCRVRDSIQFPIEYLPHFINVETWTDGNLIVYAKKDLLNTSRIGENVTFSLSHPMAGHVTVELKCLKRTFGHFELFFDSVNETENEWFSRRLSNKGDLARFRNVCIENDKLLFFLPMLGRAKNLEFWGSEMKFEIIPWTVPWYLQRFNITRTNETAYIIPPFDKIAWRSLLFHLLPIANSIETNTFNESRRKQLFLFRDLPPKGSGEITKRLSVHGGAKIKDIACFKSLVFPGVEVGVNENVVERVLQSNFTGLRGLFTKEMPQQKKVLFGSNAGHVENLIKEVLPEWKVLCLSPESEVSRIADAVSTARILVGGDFETLVQMVWLSPNVSAVIDLAPNENLWAAELAKRVNVLYFPVDDLKRDIQRAIEALGEL